MLTVMRFLHGARRAVPLLAGALAAVLAACGSDQGTTPQTISCKSDSDCPSGQICGGSTCQPSSISGAGGSSNNNPGTGARSSSSTCGNGVAEGSEACDGSDLNGKSCESLTSGASTGTLSCTATCDFSLAGCRPAGAGGIVGGGGTGGNFGAGGYLPPGSGGYLIGSGGFVEGTGGYLLGTGGSSTCDRNANWLNNCATAADCGGCFSCVQVCSACTPECADPCQSDADCTGTSVGTLATPYCFLLDATYGGRCSSSP